MLTSDGFVSRPGGVKDSNPLNTIQTGDKCCLHGPPVCLPMKTLQKRTDRFRAEFGGPLDVII